jgi:hypothetical protein
MSRNRILLSVIAGVLLVSAVVIALIVFSGGGVPTTASTIASGGYLQPGRSIRSANDRFSLNMQTDGNLVEYSEQGRVVQWETDTSGNFGAYLVMQADGNLVVYPSGKTAPAPGQPTPALWDSGTEGHPGSYAALLNDGALEVRAFRNVRLLWTSPSSHS